MDTILIVDDEKNYTLILSALLEEEGFHTFTANNAHEALKILENSDIDLVLTDMKMPGMDGIELLEHVKKKDTNLPVIMMTAFGTVEKAVEAIQKGAYHYILKPFDNENLVIYAKKAIDMYRMARENRELRNSMASKYSFGQIIGKSKAMQNLFDIIRKVAPSTAPILVEGETGTGKELVARSILYTSTRRAGPFIAVNCAALSENLLESELFGHEKGAFTGAMSMKKGRFELADRGTLFLDEIGEISPNLQVKLLRVLQEKVFERVGGTRPILVDIRVIAATNKNLKEEIERGRFREDLYYRLNVIHLTLPPLRERIEDIRTLSQHFILKHQEERHSGVPVKGVSQEVERLFYEYAWPGNIRELENVIERAMILCPGDTIAVSDLPKTFHDKAAHGLSLDAIPERATLSETLAEVEKALILKALQRADNVQSHAARLLGIGKSGLNQKIKKYNLNLENLKEASD